MATEYITSLLYPLSWSSSIKIENLEFVHPYFGDIFIIDCETIQDLFPVLYYGDTMTMQGWERLHFEFGEVHDDEKIWTLQSGYLYEYYVAEKTFIITDSTGSEVYRVYPVNNISDLHIDFTIYSSHQFRFYLGMNPTEKHFILDALLKYRTYGESLIGEDFFITPNNSNYSDIHYSSALLADMPKIISINDVPISVPSVFIVPYYMTIGHFRIYKDPEYFCNTSGVYDTTYKVFNAVHTPQPFEAVLLQFNWLYALLSRDFTPSLFPTERPSEVNNNRPVYEPWLIWGCLKYLFLHRDFDGEDNLIDVFDLSPNWV